MKWVRRITPYDSSCWGGQALKQPSTHFKNKPGLAKFLKRLPCETLDAIPKKVFKKMGIEFVDTQQHDIVQ